MSTTDSTPGMARTVAASNDATVAPTTGAILTAAYTNPGGRASMPNTALPLALARVSRRGAGCPIRRNSRGSFRRTSAASTPALTLAARRARLA
jgi:hypothetical protein